MRPLRLLPPALLALATVQADDDLQITTTKNATCAHRSEPGDTLSVHYRGTLAASGTQFDASYNRNKPFTFVLGAGHVIAGWEEGLKGMCPGEERTLTVPSSMGYGEFGSPPVIPGGATLVFETVLVGIEGWEEEEEEEEEAVTKTVSGSVVYESAGKTTKAGEWFTIATAPPEPTDGDGVEGTWRTATPMSTVQDGAEATPTMEIGGVKAAPATDDKASEATQALEAKPLPSPSANESEPDGQEGECHLLGPFALLVQGALGIMALLSLVYKRWRETPKRPWRVWFFDVSKQVVGSVLVHVLNLLMSMLGAGDIEHASQTAAAGKTSSDAQQAGGKSSPNPCSYYLLNLLIDTTIGIAILYLLLKVIHVAASYTPLARPPESIKSGHYGQPPHPTWWLKQSLLYFLGLVGMKLFVLLLFLLLPWLPWVGDWMLRWTEGNEALEIAFVMFIFPLLMNGLQYWIIDNFIMDKEGRGRRGEDGGAGGEYQRVEGSEDGIDGEEDDARVGKAGEESGLVHGEGSREGSRGRKERDD